MERVEVSPAPSKSTTLDMEDASLPQYITRDPDQLLPPSYSVRCISLLVPLARSGREMSKFLW